MARKSSRKKIALRFKGNRLDYADFIDLLERNKTEFTLKQKNEVASLVDQTRKTVTTQRRVLENKIMELEKMTSELKEIESTLDTNPSKATRLLNRYVGRVASRRAELEPLKLHRCMMREAAHIFSEIVRTLLIPMTPVLAKIIYDWYKERKARVSISIETQKGTLVELSAKSLSSFGLKETKGRKAKRKTCKSR